MTQPGAETQEGQAEPAVPGALETAAQKFNEFPWGWALFVILSAVLAWAIGYLAVAFQNEQMIEIDLSGTVLRDQPVHKLKLGLRWIRSADENEAAYWEGEHGLAEVWGGKVRGHFNTRALTQTFESFPAFLERYVADPFVMGLTLPRKGAEFSGLVILSHELDPSQQELRTRAAEAGSEAEAINLLRIRTGLPMEKAADHLNAQRRNEAWSVAANNLGLLGEALVGLLGGRRGGSSGGDGGEE